MFNEEDAEWDVERQVQIPIKGVPRGMSRGKLSVQWRGPKRGY